MLKSVSNTTIAVRAPVGWKAASDLEGSVVEAESGAVAVAESPVVFELVDPEAEWVAGEEIEVENLDEADEIEEKPDDEITASLDVIGATGIVLVKLEARVLVQRVVLDGAMVGDEVAVLDGTASLAGTEVLNEMEVPDGVAVSDGIAVPDEAMALDEVETPGTLSEALEVCDAPGSRPQTVSVTVTTFTSSIRSASILPICKEEDEG